jgi:hypothetical protein
MSDAVARALGAGEVITVGGVEYTISPIELRQMHEVRREAIRSYKREYLQTFADNLDLLDGGDNGAAAKLLERKMEEAARWDVSDLPTKAAYDVTKVPINEKLKTVLEDEFGEVPDKVEGQRALLAAALDSEKLDGITVKRLTDRWPHKVDIPYDTWWVTASYDGMITFVWSSVHLKHPDVTKKQVEMWPMAKIIEAARMVERLTVPAVENM